MSTTISVSDWSVETLRGFKEKRGHKTYDSALREIFIMADLNEEELIEIYRKNNEDKSDSGGEKDGSDENKSDDASGSSIRDMWG